MKTQMLPATQRPAQANKWLRYLVICAGIVALPILLGLSLVLWMGTGNWSLLPFWS